MWFLIGIIVGALGVTIGKPYLLKAWEWLKSKFTKIS